MHGTPPFGLSYGDIMHKTASENTIEKSGTNANVEISFTRDKIQAVITEDIG